VVQETSEPWFSDDLPCCVRIADAWLDQTVREPWVVSLPEVVLADLINLSRALSERNPRDG